MHIDDKHADNHYTDNHYTDDQFESALRTLDPADRHIDPLGSRAAADLEAILATGHGMTAGPGTGLGSGPGTNTGPGRGGSAGGARGTRRRRRTSRFSMRPPVRRAALVGAAAAVLAGAIVAVPTLLPDGDQGFTSWAAVPEPLPAPERPGAAEDCREGYRDGPGDYSAYLDEARVAVAERRGDWITVVLSGSDGFTATCITDASASLFSRGMIGSIGASAEMPGGARDLWPVSMGLGVVSNEELSMIIGYSGADVTGVTYSSPDHGEVTATVSDERFALWMPGDELRDAHRDGVEVEVTYADGATDSVRLSY